MSLSRNHLSQIQHAFPSNNNNINCLMFNATFVGACFSKFQVIDGTKAFVWELTSAEIKMAKSGHFKSAAVKEIEFQSDALYRAQFFMKMMPNGSAIFKAMIKRDENKVVSLNARYYFVTNGIEKMDGEIITPNIFAKIHDQNGRLEIVAEFIE